LNLAHHDGSETPAPLVLRRRYRVRIQLNDAGCVIPAGHRIRVAVSTTYWPMLWPSPEAATVTVFEGSINLPVRPRNAADALLPALPDALTAPPEPTTVLGPGTVRIDRIGLELGVQRSSNFSIDGEDPLSACTETTVTQTIAREAWRVRIETHTRMWCTHDAFRLRATLLAWEGDDEICRREWDYDIPRDLL
jgi:hypothetical protein